MLKKMFTLSVTILFSAVLIAGCGKKSDVPAAKTTKNLQDASTATKLVTLDVQGMTCSGCEYNVKSALKKVDGVKEVDASSKNAVAIVRYDPKLANVEEMVAAVNQSGYKASAPAQKKNEGE